MNRIIYPYRLTTFRQYDDVSIVAYLNEEVIENYVPETSGMESEGNATEPITAYAYTGPMKDGGTLIDGVSVTDRDSLVNGIIRSKYSQTQEDAIKTHRLMSLSGQADAGSYDEEWQEFLTFRSSAIKIVDKWLEQDAD